ncbi:prolyl-tRNA synthetase associated domain-containing protein [Rhodoplanes roseus]|uniref:DNA-binding protein n=1 Tax=Rhodoplanes roseus TaxID=29409 RepID=A0A327KP47_9BRAD|nr:prolyl-tRNA synthetase associated domain-containing protein [Rhodoplanes roseus]RAI39135.1 DNA-binding protein [Rhodoplanes roseus]
MPAAPEDLFACLDRLGVPHRTVTHPPLFTVEESRALRGTIPGGHTKNLFLKDKRGTLFLVVALEDAVIDLKGLHRRLDAGRFSFGSAELLQEALGVMPGSVTPFAAINDTGGRVTVVLDEPMLAYDPLNCHPLVNTMTTAIAPGDLVRFLRHTGHEPRLATVSGGSPDGSGERPD